MAFAACLKGMTLVKVLLSSRYNIAGKLIVSRYSKGLGHGRQCAGLHLQSQPCILQRGSGSKLLLGLLPGGERMALSSLLLQQLLRVDVIFLSLGHLLGIVEGCFIQQGRLVIFQSSNMGTELLLPILNSAGPLLQLIQGILLVQQLIPFPFRLGEQTGLIMTALVF